MPEPDYPRTVGRYVIHEPFASGGMATIHLGRLVGPVGFSRVVAIKRLHEHLASDLEFVQMFLDEARIAARIRHPNVVSTLDVVELDNELFLVMDYVQGESLGNLLRIVRNHDTRIPANMLCSILAGVLHGLHAAHEASDEQGQPLGIIHRDVTPQNILVGADGVARIADFGIAQATGRMHHTREGQIKGKVQYMSPEQLTSAPVDRRSDIYSASVVLWEALTGQKLFAANTDAQIMYKVLEGKPEKPSVAGKNVPPALDDIVLKGLKNKASERYATAQEMALALEQAVVPVPASTLGAWVREQAAGPLAQAAKFLQLIEQTDHPRPLPRRSGSIIPPGLSRSPSIPPPPEAQAAAAPKPGAPKPAAPKPAGRPAPLKTVPLASAALVPALRDDAEPRMQFPSSMATLPPPSLSSPALPPPTPDLLGAEALAPLLAPPAEALPEPAIDPLAVPGIAAPLNGLPIEAPRKPPAAPAAATAEAEAEANGASKDEQISFPELAPMQAEIEEDPLEEDLVPRPPSRHRKLVLGVVGASALLLCGGALIRALTSEAELPPEPRPAAAATTPATTIAAATQTAAPTATQPAATATQTTAEPTEPPAQPTADSASTAAPPQGSAVQPAGVPAGKGTGGKKRNRLYQRD